MTEEYQEVFSGILSEIKTINGEKELFYEKNYARIGVNTDDNLPLNVSLKLPVLTILLDAFLKKMVDFIHKFI